MLNIFAGYYLAQGTQVSQFSINRTFSSTSAPSTMSFTLLLYSCADFGFCLLISVVICSAITGWYGCHLRAASRNDDTTGIWKEVRCVSRVRITDYTENTQEQTEIETTCSSATFRPAYSNWPKTDCFVFGRVVVSSQNKFHIQTCQYLNIIECRGIFGKKKIVSAALYCIILYLAVMGWVCDMRFILLRGRHNYKIHFAGQWIHKYCTPDDLRTN